MPSGSPSSSGHAPRALHHADFRVGLDVGLPEGHAGAHVEQVTHRGPVVPGVRDLGDVLRHGRLEVQLPLTGEEPATQPTTDLVTDISRCGVVGVMSPK